MKYINLLALVLSVAAQSAFASQAKSTMKIQIDKGSVSVEIVPGLKRPEVTSSRTPGCNSDAVVASGTNSIQVTHLATCQNGSKIKIRLGSTVTSEVNLQAGSLTLLQAAKALQSFSEVKGVVLAGTITSSVPGLIPTRTENYAGATATYPGASSGPRSSLSLIVQAGSLQL